MPQAPKIPQSRRIPPDALSPLDHLDGRYSVILCDIWGCVHDGVQLYPGAAERLGQWRSEGRTIILITNAPRTAEAVEAQLERIGLPADTWDGIATSGEAGIAALKQLAQPVGFLGTDADLKIEAKHIADLARLVDQNIINRSTAKTILGQIIKTGEMPSQLATNINASKIDDTRVIAEAVESIFVREKSAVIDAKTNPNVANFLLGKVMQLTKGKADPKIALNLITTKLTESN